MRKDIQDALLSVGEVAVFAWSLLELLLTRILPLAGFLAGHLLLQFCRLLASVVIAVAGGRISVAGGRHEPEAEYSYAYDAQAEEQLMIEEENVQVVKDHNDLEGFKSRSDKQLEERQTEEESVILPSNIAAHDDEDSLLHDVQAAAMPAVDDELHVDVDVAESVPYSDAAANEVHVVPAGSDVYGHVQAESTDAANVIVSEGSADLEAQRRSEGEMMRKSRRRPRMRVLPPSLSQVKRSLMQRSRRASASPSPAAASSTPSPSPSPMKKKKHNISPRSRKLASPLIKSSNSFMGKFRKHFLLDPA